MEAMGTRMLDGSSRPDEASVKDWLGVEAFAHWKALTDFIDANYPGVFAPEWMFAGRSHGWGCRYKKSKSFCWLVPERFRASAMIVFGREERDKAEIILPELKSHVREDYEKANTFHDGKWMLTALDSNDVVADVTRLLTVKRKPRPQRSMVDGRRSMAGSK